MTRGEYYFEVVAEFLDGIGVTLSSSQSKELTENLSLSAEMESTYYGHDCIPNPGKTEADLLRKEIKEAQSRHEREIDSMNKVIANRLGYYGDDERRVRIAKDGVYYSNGRTHEI